MKSNDKKGEIVIYKELTIEKLDEMDYDFFLEELYNLAKPDLRELSKVLFKFIKLFLTKKYQNLPWEEIETEYFRDKDLLRRYILVKTFIFQNYLAEIDEKELECELKEIANKIDSLPTGITNLDKGKGYYGEESSDYGKFCDIIDDYSRRLTELFQRVSLIYAKEHRQNFLEDRADNRIKGTIQGIGKAGGKVSYYAQMGRNIDKRIEQDENILTPEDLRLKHEMDEEKRDIFIKNKNRKKK